MILLLALQIVPNPAAEWGAPLENVQKVLDAAASELGLPISGKILVEPTGGPITLFKRGPNGEIHVKLATGGLLWAQYTYQFSHELAHIQCGFDEDPHRHKWFEEGLCETASLFVLRRSAETWKSSPPYPTWKNYAPSLARYADDRLANAKLPDGMTPAEWALEKLDDHAKGNVVASLLLPLFEKDPSRWEAVSGLNTEKMDEKTTFAEYLAAWKRHCPEKHRAFVEEVAALFDVKL